MIVSSENLSKSYGTFRALTDCNISVNSGEVFGLLGPNGAGKTTLLRTLLGFIKPTSGLACIAGFNCASQSVRVRQKTAYLPGEARLFRRNARTPCARFLFPPTSRLRSKKMLRYC